ncbi:uncharacterized protein [Pocillopora verrucosa]|uniref:uncharacterized protein n=1 Tax=Pocillopora verrucosa TaxID=203993 RepID=UPI0033429AC1
MDHYMTKITFCLLFWMIPLDGVSAGRTLTMMVNISDDNQQADYIYLGKGSPSIRIIKLLKGENGGGTCYHEIPRCKENYGHRHSEEKTPNITVRDVIKSVEGSYRLYPYCLGSNHHCTTDQPLKSFMLFAEVLGRHGTVRLVRGMVTHELREI